MEYMKEWLPTKQIKNNDDLNDFLYLNFYIDLESLTKSFKN